MILVFQVCFTDLSLNLLGEHSQSILLGKSSSCERESATFFISRLLVYNFWLVDLRAVLTPSFAPFRRPGRVTLAMM